MNLSWLTIIAILFSNTATAQNADENANPKSNALPGVLIPLSFVHPPAYDLTYNDIHLTPSEAKELVLKDTDISKLNPLEDTNLWKNTPPTPYNPEIDNLDFKDGDTFYYTNLSDVIIGNVCKIVVRKKDSQGIYRNYLITFSKKAHNILVRKALLRKLGYVVEPTQHLRRFRLVFKNSFEKKTFISKDPQGPLYKGTSGDPSRWVTNLSDKDSDYLDMQDAVISAAEIPAYNLAFGPLKAKHIQNRRILNAISVVYGLTEVPESVNIFSWFPGRIINEQLYLQFDAANQFSTPYEDARWITRRLLSLNRADFVEVVKQADYPEKVQKLMVEKLISRRNELRKIFKLEGQDIAFNPDISDPPELINGQLVKQEWPGYGSRFTWDEVASPLSATEITALIKSKAISTAISSLNTLVNSEMPKTDMAKAAFEHQYNLAYERFREYVKTGKITKTPFGIWTTKAYNTNIIASREVIAGNYLGTDNTIQLADTIGVSVDAGVVIGTDGLPVPWSVGGRTQAYFTKTYTHLKPTKSIKASLEEPYRNIIVPLVKSDNAQILHQLFDGSLETLTPKEQKEKIAAVVGEFKNHLQIGESLIISDNIGSNVNVMAGYGFSERLQAQMQFDNQLFVMNRIHIFRRDENTIQIYKDLGQAHGVQLAFSLKSQVQFLDIKMKRTTGKARIYFYSLNITPGETNPGLLENMRALREVLTSSSFEFLNSIQEPVKIEHRFNEKLAGIAFFFLDWLGLRTESEIKVSGLNQPSKKFVRVATGSRTGNDYQSLGVKAINSLIDHYSEYDIAVPNTTSGNPGDTFFGKSTARTVEFESEINQDNKSFVEPFANISYTWKGWQISKKKAQKILDEIKEKYGIELYHKLALKETEKLQLYNIGLNLFVYHDGIDHMARLSHAYVQWLLDKYGNFPEPDFHSEQNNMRDSLSDPKTNALYDYKYYQKNYRYYLRHGKSIKAARFGGKMVSLLESVLAVEGLIAAVGGTDNILIQSSIQGFRDKDENAYTPLISDTKGRFGSSKTRGPIRFEQQNLNMTESEFYAYWLLRKM